MFKVFSLSIYATLFEGRVRRDVDVFVNTLSDPAGAFFPGAA